MTEQDREKEIEELMDRAFSEELAPEEEQVLQDYLQQFPEYRSRWAEYQTLKHGIAVLENSQAPSETTVARVQRAASEKISRREQKKLGTGWRFFLSRPVKVAAMLLVFAGVGIYSQYWLKSRAPQQPFAPSPPTEGVKMEVQEDLPEPKLPTPEKSRLKKAPEKKMPFKPQPEVSLPPPPPDTRRDQAPAAVEEKNALPTKLMEAEPAPSRALEQPGLDRGVLPAAKMITTGGATAPQAPTPSAQKKLINTAKEKMKAGDYEGALQDLLDAQKLGDNEEIRRLIDKCRSEIRLKDRE